jgi:hypothetical protein
MYHTTLALCLPFSAYGDLQGRRRGITGSGPLFTRARREVSGAAVTRPINGASGVTGSATTCSVAEDEEQAEILDRPWLLAFMVSNFKTDCFAGPFETPCILVSFLR